MKKTTGIILTSVALLIMLSICISIYIYFFSPNNQMIEAFDEDNINLVIEDKLIEDANVKIQNDNILIRFEIVKQYFDKNIFWEENSKTVTVTTENKLIRMKADKTDASMNNKPIKLETPVIQENSAVFIPISFLSDLYDIDINYIKDTNVVIIDHRNKSKQFAEPLKEEVVIRRGMSIKQPILKRIDKANADTRKMRAFEESEKWYKVRSSDGIIGFVEKKVVRITEIVGEKTTEKGFNKAQFKPTKGKINLVWDAIYQYSTGWSDEGKIEGLDVLSPTWFEVKDEDGTLLSRASSEYVKWAHKNGYEVWAHLSNNVGGADNTGEFLNNTESRDNAIKKVLEYSSLYKLDGINIDFEDINKIDKDVYTQFVRELAALINEQGLIVSVDITVPGGSANWSLCYDRMALSEAVDYVMLMTYDQYWAGSSIAGSVSELSWVEENINLVLKEVPKEKFLLGLPFYTRVWKEKEGEKPQSRAISMGTAQKLVEENNAKVTWNELCGQFYTEYKVDGILNRLWIEDKTSINLRSALVNKYDLAGVASWRKDFETSDIWSVLNKNLKENTNYNEWLKQNKTNVYK